MAYRRDEFAVGEWYHCYSRGVDKRIVFENTSDLDRFMQTLFISNDVESAKRSNFQHMDHDRIFAIERSKPIVSIGAYSLMPNHFHILIQEVVEGGISRFMHKVGTSYTMYFNIKNKRTGNLFTKPFRSKRIADDRYFQKVAQYIHLNAAELFDRSFKKGTNRQLVKLEKQVRGYRYASFQDYCGIERAEKVILDDNAVQLIRTDLPSFQELLEEARDYYKTIAS